MFEKWLTDIAVTLYDKGYSYSQMKVWQPIAEVSDFNADTIAEIMEKLEREDF